MERTTTFDCFVRAFASAFGVGAGLLCAAGVAGGLMFVGSVAYSTASFSSAEHQDVPSYGVSAYGGPQPQAFFLSTEPGVQMNGSPYCPDGTSCGVAACCPGGTCNANACATEPCRNAGAACSAGQGCCSSCPNCPSRSQNVNVTPSPWAGPVASLPSYSLQMDAVGGTRNAPVSTPPVYPPAVGVSAPVDPILLPAVTAEPIRHSVPIERPDPVQINPSTLPRIGIRVETEEAPPEPATVERK